ncbi:MAG: hypothetical protein EHM34_05395 [Nitrosopumilales archaeon]|nr:MAG: hypothetical protein EHM34_05395 [Nitrosopumilales archaeon]
MTVPNLGLNLTISPNCTQCCPRRLRIFGCCCCDPDDDQQDQAEKVDAVAKENLTPREGTTRDLSFHIDDKEVIGVLQICDVLHKTPRNENDT